MRSLSLPSQLPLLPPGNTLDFSLSFQRFFFKTWICKPINILLKEEYQTFRERFPRACSFKKKSQSHFALGPDSAPQLT